MLLIMKQGSEGESRPKMQSRNLSFTSTIPWYKRLTHAPLFVVVAMTQVRVQERFRFSMEIRREGEPLGIYLL